MIKPPVKALLQLLRTGQCPAESGLDSLLTGLAHPGEGHSGWTMSRRLLTLRQQLTCDEEAVAALLATQPAIREPWLAVMAGRTKEAGKLSHPEALVQLVSNLGQAAGWVEQALPAATLNPTPLQELERQLLGHTVEQNQSLPSLTRILAAAATMARWQQEALALPALAIIDTSGEHPEKNWCRGRLLALPDTFSPASTILPGRKTLDANDDRETLLRISTSPWLFLLSAIAYAQDSWAAEQRGKLLLELPAGWVGC